ncbi:threonine/serine ThrE exporter family protein [Amantichitinum ursilacus]|uniref:Inner membrane protein YjjP n=1 Tax=Amantichitinum ursilacus TaxID=857265 RepID=A0A0N0XHX2_9NEIS|nr:threonine/serine exporter family protein [Amantichitinum ursilacus]KPC52116.1 Inner membrane protein YjjP [Amantichitinum ursilacus]
MSTEAEISLAQVTHLALQIGLLAHSCGGDTARTSAAMQRCATALGAHRVDTVVSSLNLGLTLEMGVQRETALRKAPHMGVNFRALNALERALTALEAGRISPAAFKSWTEQIAADTPRYPPWLIVVFVGIACGGFAALFHGDLAAIALTTVASAIGMATRQALVKRGLQPLMFATAAAFVATLITGAGHALTSTPDAALAACVLFLIPGVPLINGTSDLLQGNYLNGNVRLTMAIVIIVGIAIGMSLALRMVG